MTRKKSTKQSVSNLVNNLKMMQSNDEETISVEIFHDGTYLVKSSYETESSEFQVIQHGNTIQELAELAKQ